MKELHEMIAGSDRAQKIGAGRLDLIVRVAERVASQNDPLLRECAESLDVAMAEIAYLRAIAKVYKETAETRTIPIEKLRELSEKATPGPWRISTPQRGPSETMEDVLGIVSDDDADVVCHGGIWPSMQPQADAELIVAAVNAVRSILPKAAK